MLVSDKTRWDFIFKLDAVVDLVSRVNTGESSWRGFILTLVLFSCLIACLLSLTGDPFSLGAGELILRDENCAVSLVIVEGGVACFPS